VTQRSKNLGVVAAVASALAAQSCSYAFVTPLVEPPPKPPNPIECTEYPYAAIGDGAGIAFGAALGWSLNHPDLFWGSESSERSTQRDVVGALMGAALAAPFVWSAYYGISRTNRCRAVLRARTEAAE